MFAGCFFPVSICSAHVRSGENPGSIRRPFLPGDVQEESNHRIAADCGAFLGLGALGFGTGLSGSIVRGCRPGGGLEENPEMLSPGLEGASGAFATLPEELSVPKIKAPVPAHGRAVLL